MRPYDISDATSFRKQLGPLLHIATIYVRSQKKLINQFGVVFDRHCVEWLCTMLEIEDTYHEKSSMSNSN